jgi:hypothetical protein
MQAFRNRVQSLRTQFYTPCLGIKRREQDGWGAVGID